jgi:hypothetical protein
MKSYHFDLGNSNTGPIGFSARVNAGSMDEALAILQEALPNELPADGLPKDIEYLNVYFNGEAITLKDIDMIGDDDVVLPDPSCNVAAPAEVPPLVRVLADEIAKAEKGLTPGTITIEVEGGCVTDVQGLPEGWSYMIVDHDVQEAP